MRKTDQPIVVIERTAPVMNATFEIAGIPLASTASLSMPITTKVAGGRYARVWASPEIIVDRGHIALLQAKTKLQSKKSEIHLGQIGNLQYQFCSGQIWHYGFSIARSASTKAPSRPELSPSAGGMMIESDRAAK